MATCDNSVTLMFMTAAFLQLEAKKQKYQAFLQKFLDTSPKYVSFGFLTLLILLLYRCVGLLSYFALDLS